MRVVLYESVMGRDKPTNVLNAADPAYAWLLRSRKIYRRLGPVPKNKFPSQSSPEEQIGGLPLLITKEHIIISQVWSAIRLFW